MVGSPTLFPSTSWRPCSRVREHYGPGPDGLGKMSDVETGGPGDPIEPQSEPQVMTVQIEGRIIWQAIGAVLMTLFLIWAVMTGMPVCISDD